MPIELTIVKSPGGMSEARQSQTFYEAGGTIGRGQDNTWTLDDPERFMSSKHSQIHFEGGQYYLEDLSTNGTFLNGSVEPIGRGNRVHISDGDRFSISDYEFQVSIVHNGVEAAPFESPIDGGPFDALAADAQWDTAQSGADLFSGDDPFGNAAGGLGSELGVSDALSNLGAGETDPLALLDSAGSDHFGPSHDNVFELGSHSDHADPMSHSVNWPQTFSEAGPIPEDWDSELDGDVDNGSNQTPQIPIAGNDDYAVLEQKYHALEEENSRLIKEIARLTQRLKQQASQPTQSRAGRSANSQDQTLVSAMGLDKWELSDQKTTEISELAGTAMRETIEGMMEVLKFRKKIKEEFRINVTTIQPVENNPLKFSANIDDAMENMFIKENKAYMDPVQAVREGFQGVAEHQIAVLAGIQAAFKGMMERLDPAVLETRFEKYNKAGLLHLGHKGRNWEAYKRYHQELLNDMDNSFQHLFGYDFVRAYEEQMQRLSISRKTKRKKRHNEPG